MFLHDLPYQRFPIPWRSPPKWIRNPFGKSSSSTPFFVGRLLRLIIPFLQRVERFKTSLQFIQLAYGDFYAALDASKVADYVVFVLSPAVEVGAWGETLLRTLQTQGLPDVVPVLAPEHHIDSKARSGILKSLISFMQYFFPEQSRVFDLNTPSDQLSALRVLSEGKPRDVRWREGRSWLLAESVEWMDGNLAVTGVVRGTKLSPNRLVHLPNHGDFQVLRVCCRHHFWPFFSRLSNHSDFFSFSWESRHRFHCDGRRTYRSLRARSRGRGLSCFQQ